jgi:glycosyltransferase involved in cell wall biosynthesis
MRVIYDIMVLGNGFYSPAARTGVFRAIENLADELVKAQVISSFTSGTKLVDFFQCSDYLLSNKGLKGASLLRLGLDEKTIELFRNFHERAHSKAGKNTFNKVLNRIANKIADVMLAGKIMNLDALREAEIYHSPFYPFPVQVKRIQKLKKVITVYDLIPVLYPQFFENTGRGFMEQVLKSIDENVWVTCISHATKNDLCNYLPALNPSRVFVTHLAASSMFYPCRDQAKIEAIKAKFAIPDGPYVLSLSTLEPRKNITQTIKCFSRLVEEESINDLSLVLVGTKGWDFDSIFNEIAANPKIRDRIIVTGYVADEYLAPLYSEAMMFVYPSFYEGFGLPPLEAMQCGVPVITSNTSSLPEVVGDAGIMVDPQDADELCQAILKIYNSAEVREKMSHDSLAQALKFSWGKCAEQTIDAYKAAIAG